MTYYEMYLLSITCKGFLSNRNRAWEFALPVWAEEVGVCEPGTDLTGGGYRGV